ncbi:DUF4426 domain-containing protein [Candidatus Sororendozoicomonas aggregata]|uniref:DUF4426 domain-containing protein n=1 Tax=Candidatus Sororendozoicomonas aggregata TaxID=3073239 RepID=UPI002ED13A30
MKKGILASVTALLLFVPVTVPAVAFASAPASVPDAEPFGSRSMRAGDYDIHYSAFNSTFIPPEVAKAYSLERGPRTGILNIAIRNVKSSELGTAVKGLIEGNMTNLLGQRTALTFHEVNEGHAVYYLASFRFSNEEQLTFDLAVTPDKHTQSERVTFSQQFYEGEKS